MTLYEYIPRHEYTTNFVLLQPIHLLHHHPHHLLRIHTFPPVLWLGQNGGHHT